MTPEEQTAIQDFRDKLHVAQMRAHRADIILEAGRLMTFTREHSLAALDQLRGATALLQDLDNILAGNTPPKKRGLVMEYFLAEFILLTNDFPDTKCVYRLVKADNQFEAERMAEKWAEAMCASSFGILQTIS